MKSEPIVTVGIPTYNRPEGLERALLDICRQTYPRLEIVVSDNGSPNPLVAKILDEHSAKDSRIKVFRQVRNLGILQNFVFVWEQSRGDFFMWAADDDRWEPDFVESLLPLMTTDSSVGFAFCNFDVRRDDGTKAAVHYPPFEDSIRPFTDSNPFRRMRSFIMQPENHGKANMFYSIFRRNLLKQVNPEGYLLGGRWGFDMLMVSDALSRTRFGFNEKIKYHVGIAPESPAPTQKESPPANQKPKSQKPNYSGYFTGYATIIAGSPLLNLSQKLSLLLICGIKAMRWH